MCTFRAEIEREASSRQWNVVEAEGGVLRNHAELGWISECSGGRIDVWSNLRGWPRPAEYPAARRPSRLKLSGRDTACCISHCIWSRYAASCGARPYPARLQRRGTAKSLSL